MRVLIVEDHEPTATAFCRLISKKMPNIQCIIAKSLSAGLLEATTTRADITLLDLILPKNDGDTEKMPLKEVIQSIRLFPRPVIVITGLADPDGSIAAECFKYGCQNFLDKASLSGLISTMTSAYLRDVMPKQLEKEQANVIGASRT